MAPQKLKRVVIKEELVELTGDFKYALILNQFIYWTERRRDFDKFIEEEKKRAKTEGKELNINKTGGWVYKSSDDLADELMLGKSKTTLSRYVKELEEMGYIDSRQNPEYKWDKTKQYRVNLIKINRDLLKLGYHLEGYKFDSMYKSIASCLEEKLPESKENTQQINSNNSEINTKNTSNPKNTKSSENVDSSDFSKLNDRGFNMNNRENKMKHRSKDMKHRNSKTETAIPETTTEITTKTKNRNIEEDEQRAQKENKNSEKNHYPKKSTTELTKIKNKFEQVFNRIPSNFELEKLLEAEKNLELILKAIELTGLNSRNRTLSYTIALLKDWQDKGLSTSEEVEKMIESHRRRRKSNQNTDKKDTSSSCSEGFDLDISRANGWNTGIEEVEVNEE